MRLNSQFCLVIYLLFINIQTYSGASNPQESTPTPNVTAVEIFSRLRESLAQLHSLELKSSTTSKAPTPKDPTGTTSIQNSSHVFLKDQKFLVKMTTTNPALNTPITKTLAFDGKEYQTIDDSKGALVTGSTMAKENVQPVYGSPQPFTIMFDFAYQFAPKKDLPTLFDPGLWEQVAGSYKITEHSLVGSDPCIVLTMDSDTNNAHTEIYLSEQYSYYPLKVVTKSNHFTREDTVVEYQVVEPGTRPLIIPTQVKSTGRLVKADLPVTSQLTVDPGSIQYNKPLNENMFTLSKEQVPVVIDMNTGLAYKDGVLVKERSDAQQIVTDPSYSLNTILCWLSALLLIVGISIKVFLSRSGR